MCWDAITQLMYAVGAGRASIANVHAMLTTKRSEVAGIGSYVCSTFEAALRFALCDRQDVVYSRPLFLTIYR